MLCICCLLLTQTSFSQHHYFRHFSINDGLPGTLIYRVFEDSKGYVWYLSDKGVARSDGSEIQYFTVEDGFEEVGAFHIVEDKDGVLWFISINFKLYYFKNRHFHKVNTAYKAIWIDIDPEGNKWVIDRDDQYIFRISEKCELEKHIPLKRYGAIGSSVVRTVNGFIAANGYRVEEITPDKPPQLLQKIDQMNLQIAPRSFRKRNNHILISTEHGLSDYNPFTKEITQLIHLGRNEILCFFEDTVNGDMWIGTTRGAYLFTGGAINSRNQTIYLEDQHVLCVSRSRTTGIFMFATNTGFFTCNFEVAHITKKEGLTNDKIDFCKNINGVLYLFIGNGQVNVFKDQRIEMLTDFSSRIFDVVTTEENQIVINTVGSRFHIIRDGRVYPDIRSPLFDFRYCTSCRENFYVVSKRNDIYKYVRKPQLFYDSVRTFTAIAKKATNTISIIEGKNYYITDSGFAIGSFMNGKFRSEPYTIRGRISNIEKYGKHLLVSTYNNGLFVVTQKTIKHYTEKDILLSDYCQRSVVRNNIIWLITKKGVMRFGISTHGDIQQVVTFTTNNYLINDEVNDITFGGGYVYIATSGGVSIFKEDVELPVKKPGLFIDRVQVNNADTPYARFLDLPYGKNNISILLNSPGIGFHRHPLYKYTINQDTFFTFSRNLQFSSLSPGNYQLMFWVKGGDGTWSDAPVQMDLVIRPPFWSTWWFIVLCILLFVVIAVTFLLIRFRALKRRNEFRLRTAESELRSLRLYMNPHFVFNSLTSLQSFILDNQNQAANRYIVKFSGLIRSVMMYSRKGEITLANEAEMLEEYINLEMVRFDKKIAYEITMDAGIDTMNTKIPSLLVQPFVENAIKYGLAGSDRDGVLELMFSKQSDCIFATIQDNGVGRAKVKAEQDNSPNRYESTGIKYTEERLRLLLGNKRTEKVITITDLFEGDEAKGTKVEMIIPILS